MDCLLSFLDDLHRSGVSIGLLHLLLPIGSRRLLPTSFNLKLNPKLREQARLDGCLSLLVASASLTVPSVRFAVAAILVAAGNGVI